MRAPPMALFAFCAACGADSPATDAASWANAAGVELPPSSANAVELAWQATDDACPQVYSIDVSYDVLPLQEEDHEATMVLAPHPRRPVPRTIEDDRPIPPGEIAPGQLFYEGFRVGRRGARRDTHASRTEFGPASPTAACFARTWDPMEDALALGWPVLTGRLTAVGEMWVGGRVEGKCNKSACIDPETHAGGRHNHHRPCVTRSWDERLVGVFDTEAGRYAAIESTWSDGHGTMGIWTERTTLVSVDHGRPVWSKTVVHHTFPQPTNDRSWSPIDRTWTLRAIDECPGSLAAAGLELPESLRERAESAVENMASFEERSRERQDRLRERSDTDATE